MNKIVRLLVLVLVLVTLTVSLAACGYRIRPCKEVLETAYGTEAEKASLLYNLLKAAKNLLPVLLHETEVVQIRPVSGEELAGLHVFIQYFLDLYQQPVRILPAEDLVDKL